MASGAGPGFQLGQGWEKKLIGTQQATICEYNNLWDKNLNDEICRGVMVAVLAICFFSIKRSWRPHWELLSLQLHG